MCLPITAVNAIAASMLPPESDVRGLCMVVAAITMFAGFIFTVAVALAGAARSSTPPARSTAPRLLGTLLVILVATQLALVVTWIRRHGDYDLEKAQRYGVEGLASWLASAPGASDE